MIVSNFQRGLVTNTEGISNPHETAQYVRNNRTNELGWLVKRSGITLMSEETGITDIFSHKSILLVVQNGRLRWARLDSELTFQDFVSGGYLIKEGDERVVFTGRDNYVYLGTGKASFVVDVPDYPNVPSVSAFYLPKPATPRLGRITTLAPDDDLIQGDNFALQWLNIRFQFVQLVGDQDDLENHQGAYPGQRKTDVFDLLTEKVAVSEPSDAIRIDNIVTDVTTTGDAINDLNEQQAENVRTHVRLDYTETIPPNLYIDIYRSQRLTNVEEESGMDWFWMARIPVNETQVTYTFELTDDGVAGFPELIYVGADTPSFHYITTNKFRSYAAESRSKIVWLSYYDAAQNESLYRSYTDTIPLDLGEGYITGLKFVRDNLLIVYATNQIQVIATDPLAELHNVVDFISPEDDRGNPIGCVAPESIVDMGGIHWFLASNRTLYMFNGRSVRPMSKRVKVMFDTIGLPVGDHGEAELSECIAFAYDDDFYISIPSQLEPDATEENNTVLLYDTEYGRWWQDSFGVQSLTKIYPDQPVAIVNGKLYKLYVGNDDAGDPIRRVWRNNPYAASDRERFESIHVYVQSPAQVDIKAITEHESFETDINVENPEIWDSLRAGCNLRGRLQQIEISTESDTVIDRVATNQKLRNR